MWRLARRWPTTQQGADQFFPVQGLAKSGASGGRGDGDVVGGSGSHRFLEAKVKLQDAQQSRDLRKAEVLGSAILELVQRLADDASLPGKSGLSQPAGFSGAPDARSEFG